MNDTTLTTRPESATEVSDGELSTKKALLILPHYNFRDKEYSWLVERLDPTGLKLEVASSHTSDAQGRFGTIVKPDFLVNYVEADDYDAFIFIGEEAANEYFDNQDVRRILEKAFARRKIVAAIGAAVPIIAYSGHLVGKKVTSVDSERQKLEELGAYFTGRIYEQDGDIITANGPYATREFAEGIIKALKWLDGNTISGRRYLR